MVITNAFDFTSYAQQLMTVICRALLLHSAGWKLVSGLAFVRVGMADSLVGLMACMVL